MQMPRRLLTHPPCLASITFLYMSVLFPSSHHSIICILSLICANVVIICKCHTKTDYYCCEFNELGDDPPRTLQQRAGLQRYFWKIQEIISLQESQLVTASPVPNPKNTSPAPASTVQSSLRFPPATYWPSWPCSLMSLPTAPTWDGPGSSHNLLNHHFLPQLTCFRCSLGLLWLWRVTRWSVAG